MTRDDDLARLIQDSVSDVEPHDGLHAIQNRTKVVPMSRTRPWLYAVAGAAVATAAVVAAIALAGGSLPGFQEADDAPAASTPTSTARPTPSGSATPSAVVPSDSASAPTATATSSAPVTRAVPVYYVGDGPQGPVLFREFHPGAAGDPLQAAIEGLQSTPLDPDYSTPWQAGSLAGASFDGVGSGGRITVTLGDASLRDRPSSMSAAYAAAAVQQVVYTLQAATQTRAPVQFLLGGDPVDTVLGVPTPQPVPQGKPLKVLSLMNISTPNEGAIVSGKLPVSGVNNGFEATVVLRLMQGDKAVLTRSGIAQGWMGDKLFPWQLTLDLSKVTPGSYTLVASNDDPSGGEGKGPATDTRTIVVK